MQRTVDATALLGAMMFYAAAASGCADEAAPNEPALAAKIDGVAPWTPTLAGPTCASMPYTVGACQENEPMDWLYFQWNNRALIRDVLADRVANKPNSRLMGIDVQVWRGSSCVNGCPSTPEGLHIEFLLDEIATTPDVNLQYVWMPAYLACDLLLRNGSTSTDTFSFADGSVSRVQNVAFYMYAGWIYCG